MEELILGTSPPSTAVSRMGSLRKALSRTDWASRLAKEPDLKQRNPEQKSLLVKFLYVCKIEKREKQRALKSHQLETQHSPAY